MPSALKILNGQAWTSRMPRTPGDVIFLFCASGPKVFGSNPPRIVFSGGHCHKSERFFAWLELRVLSLGRLDLKVWCEPKNTVAAFALLQVDVSLYLCIWLVQHCFVGAVSGLNFSWRLSRTLFYNTTDLLSAGGY